MSLAAWLNTAWMWKCSAESYRFHRATRDVAGTQATILQQILAANRDTEIGRKHGFAGIRTVADFQRQVPLTIYEDYQDAIERIGAGQSNILTRENVELLEPTSGSTGGEKLIPFTRSLRRQFQCSVAAWIADLFRQQRGVCRGRAYWSISPALGGPRQSSGGIPIGFDDDTAYLGGMERLFLDRLLAVPASVARIPDIEAFRYCTLWYLLRAEDLALISVWSPTFLSALLAPLPAWIDRLCFDLRRGRPEPPKPLPLEFMQRTHSDDRRAQQLASIFCSRGSLAEKFRQVWPRLALISCWTDAAAARCVDAVRDLFPGVPIQPKGLLATEGCVSFPLVGRVAPALAVRSHFFEFEPVSDSENAISSGHCRLAHELQPDARYRVVLTTGGGLYRYQLRDEVEVVGFENQCPLLRFLGKSDRISDLVGEKLAEAHVRGVLDRVLSAHGLQPRFALLAPTEDRPACYRLYLQGPDIAPLPSPALEKSLQAALEENPHYRYAVRLGQLAPVEILILDPEGESGWLVYERQFLRRGQRAGNIKPAALDPWTGWAAAFQGLQTSGALAHRS